MQHTNLHGFSLTIRMRGQIATILRRASRALQIRALRKLAHRIGPKMHEVHFQYAR